MGSLPSCSALRGSKPKCYEQAFTTKRPLRAQQWNEKSMNWWPVHHNNAWCNPKKLQPWRHFYAEMRHAASLWKISRLTRGHSGRNVPPLESFTPIAQGLSCADTQILIRSKSRYRTYRTRRKVSHSIEPPCCKFSPRSFGSHSHGLLL